MHLFFIKKPAKILAGLNIEMKTKYNKIMNQAVSLLPNIYSL